MKMRFLPFAFIVFLFSNFAQAQWTSLGSGITNNPRVLAGIVPINEDVIWGYSWNPNFTPAQEYARTSDGGLTWQGGTMTGVDADQFSIYLYPFDDQTAWLATADEQDPISGKIYKTTDGGVSWVHQNTGFTGFNETPAGVYFWNENEGFAYGAACLTNYDDQIAIYTTSDGGENWSKVVAPNMPPQFSGEGICLWNLTGFFSVAGDNVWFGTNKNRIFKSTDRGHTWQAFSTPFDDPNSITSIGFKDDQTGIAITLSPFRMARSSDGGETWNLLTDTSFPSNFVGSQIEYVPGTRSTWYAVVSPTKYIVSYNDGESWETFNSNIDAWSVEFLNAKTGYAGSYTTNPTTASAFKWSGPPLSNRLFVNQNASGANDGTSWANAYTDLQPALAIAEEGDQIWVAEGTYSPDTIGGSPSTTFLISKDLQLYGGFAGTETALTERGDPADHPTILSGDLNGDDVPDNFVTNRGDNVMKVVTIYANTSDATILDGFVISNGQADGVNNSQRRGAGIFSGGATQIRNCIFRQNLAVLSGGGLYFSGPTSRGAKVENCRFEKNRANNEFDAGGGLYVGNVTGEGITIHDCEFIENDGGRGSGLASYNSTLKVINSLFSGNTNIRQGGGLWFWGENPPVTLEVDSCTFENNHSSFGGGLYAYLGSNSGVSINHSTFNGNMVTPNNLGWGQGGAGLIVITGEPNTANAYATIENTQFTGNNSSNIGGGIYLVADANAFDFNLSNCGFIENVSRTNGGGIWMGSFSSTQGGSFKIDNCEFEKNICMYNGSALFSRFSGTDDIFELTNSQILENTTDSASAAVDFWGTDGGTGTVLVDRCLFDGNSSWWSAGLEMGNGWNGGASVSYTLSRSTFTNNQATEGGALSIWESENSNTEILIDSCQFDSNSASGRGGALSVLAYSSNFNATVKRSTITNNESPIGGAIDAYYWDSTLLNFPLNNTILFENTLIAENISDQATINLDSTINWTFLNCTIAENQSNGIQLGDQGFLTLQNTILHNPGFTEFMGSTGEFSAASLGGNLIGDNSFSDYALTYDTLNANPQLDADYRPMPSSPAIDKGVDLGNLPEFDLDGNDRKHGCVDIGAYESGIIVSMDCVTDSREVWETVPIMLSPNLATDLLNIELPESINKPNEISLFDAQGRLVEQRAFTPGQSLQVGHLPDGFFVLKLVDGDQVYVGRFVKQ